jgi:nucleotide-binding universal stress UspA family protein
MRILVGLDGSVASETALRWAVSVAQAENGELLVAAVRDPWFPEAWPETIEEKRGATAERLRCWSTPAIESGVPWKQLVLEGDPREQLLDTATAEKADLVVVGARGSGGHRHALHLGSTTHHLVHHTRLPVAAIPAGTRAMWPAPVVIGVDGSEGSARAVEWLAAHGKALTDNVLAVHGQMPLAQCVPQSDSRSSYHMALDRMQEWVTPLGECGLGARTLVIDGDAVDAMTDAAIAEEAGMIIVGARGAGGIKGLRLGATALKVLNQSQLPVLMVPADV